MRGSVHLFINFISKGTSADRQINKYNKNKNIDSVVDMLIEETISGC